MKRIYILIVIIFSMVSIISCNENSETGLYREGVYYAVDQQTMVSAYIGIDETGNIESVLFDKQYENTTLYTLGDDYELESGHSWRNEAHYLASYLVLNQGWDDITLRVTDITDMTALNAPDYFIEINYDLSPDDLDYITIPVDGFVLAWNLAISQASNDDVGVVLGVPTSEEWLEANKPPYNYIDGTYYAADRAHGYITRVVVEHGYIVDVVFDAITAVNTRIVWDDNNTPGDTSDDVPQVELVSMTTKQALQDDLVLVSGIPWYVEAELMRDAIIDKQTWDENWAIIVAGSHEYFNFTDEITVDGVAGVTLAIEGFRSVFEEAIEQAIPSE
ncbi:MAG: hypothetical protein KAU02_05300 [Tenericutes bacterium]|nr:hypothetical protein [Mycoplasmatota bacterium]